MKDDYCDNPCSPDKRYCYVYACCGSKDGGYYTVAFAGQVSSIDQCTLPLQFMFSSFLSPFLSLATLQCVVSHAVRAILRQLDPAMQLLRQLTYDYRTNNPILRNHINGLIGDSAPLQVSQILYDESNTLRLSFSSSYQWSYLPSSSFCIRS